MPSWKVTMRFYDNGSGLGWSITTYRADAAIADLKTAASAWMTAYMGACNNGTHVVDMRVSDIALWRDIAVYDATLFTPRVGQKVIGMMPLAEAALVVGRGAAPVPLGVAYYHLHGLDISMFGPDGTLDGSVAEIIALKAANILWFRQYRKAAKHGGAWPIVNPPIAWAVMNMEGPYVRRLGSPFALPGQRANR